MKKLVLIASLAILIAANINPTLAQASHDDYYTVTPATGKTTATPAMMYLDSLNAHNRLTDLQKQYRSTSPTGVAPATYRPSQTAPMQKAR